MKIICTIKEKQNLHKIFNQWADIPKVHGYCPFAFIYCSKIPLCDIEKDKCRECIKDHIEWEIIDKEDVFTRKEELSKEESEWLIDFITKDGDNK